MDMYIHTYKILMTYARSILLFFLNYSVKIYSVCAHCYDTCSVTQKPTELYFVPYCIQYLGFIGNKRTIALYVFIPIPEVLMKGAPS